MAPFMMWGVLINQNVVNKQQLCINLMVDCVENSYGIQDVTPNKI